MTERDEILIKLTEIVEAETASTPELLSVSEDLGLQDGLNIDSVDLASVIMGVEEFYRIKLTGEEMARIVTIRHLVDMIQIKRPIPPDVTNWADTGETASCAQDDLLPLEQRPH